LGGYAGWSKTGFSRKINSGEALDPDSLTKIAEILGVTVAFLTDESKVYAKGPIPPDALAAPTTTKEEMSDPLALVLAEYIHRKTENRERFGFEAMEKQMERLTAELGSVVEELRLTREELKKNREGFDGEHDPD